MKRFMNYIYFIFVFSLFIQNNAFAIDWHLLITPTGRQVYIDKDSIQEIKNHYFYNIAIQLFQCSFPFVRENQYMIFLRIQPINHAFKPLRSASGIE